MSELMDFVIDDNAGFCFGVVKAIDAAEEHLSANETIYCLGNIVHNSAEVRRLHDKGLEVIDYNQLDRLAQLSPKPKVMIRAHGEPPATYDRVRRLGLPLIDATCPMVLGLQKRIRSGYEAMCAVGGQVVIFGKQGHAEVIGLNGQTDNSAIIVCNPDSLDQIDFSKPIRLYSQTTMNREQYDQLIQNVSQRSTSGDFVAYDTLCNRVAGRTQDLRQFAGRVDVLIFVGGEESSNAHYLFEFCRAIQPQSYFISEVNQLQPSWCRQAHTVGITGATSTPRWLMEQVRNQLRKYFVG
ncbi:MAG: 4-hydroxy-3-methylbut-2-enyl diphosphate reductase [Bacteroidales bacterium]|nr:4-hydroxy-3-methylbut-2-enyl diphosphate reductase [Candidatus Colimorpha onthohippi]